MAQAMVNFRMDAELKQKMEETCRKMGLTMTSAFTMFAVKVTNEQRIPFEVCVDPFYSEENIDRLKKAAVDADAGRNMTEHELLDATDD